MYPSTIVVSLVYIDVKKEIEMQPPTLIQYVRILQLQYVQVDLMYVTKN
ncbi:unnamed protein product [Schistosoma curassoni]|uniref:Uncharacterized protein n=1 Tax=Schistosoma curassoni TaxID=6186 RepID=A0A183K3T7_9TREM|nr:unnamed protein product [Schistosoma curassoni]